jgi:hypothetical protein
MRIAALCTRCPHELVFLELQDEHVYRFRCERGHETQIWLQNDRYDLIFHSACLAFLDGYHREAVFGLSVSLERFLEFCIEVLSTHIGIPADAFAKSWQLVSRQSERQLGMFVGMWLAHIRQAPRLLPSKWAEFRNGVVHSGRLPSRAEVIEYGDQALVFIGTHLDALRENAQEAIFDRAVAHQVKDRGLQSPDTAVVHIPTTVSAAMGTRPTSFSQALIEVAALRERVHGAG